MNALFYLFSFVILFTSCANGNNQEKMKINSMDTTINISPDTPQLEYDTIIIQHWNGYEARLHRLEFSKGQLKLYCDESDFKSEIKSQAKTEQLVSLIEQFYVKKTDSIILEKISSDNALISNYSSIVVKVEDKGKLLVDERTQIGSEKYEIEYNPDFLKFYELVKQLTSSCSK